MNLKGKKRRTYSRIVIYKKIYRPLNDLVAGGCTIHAFSIMLFSFCQRQSHLQNCPDNMQVYSGPIKIACCQQFIT